MPYNGWQCEAPQHTSTILLSPRWHQSHTKWEIDRNSSLQKTKQHWNCGFDSLMHANGDVSLTKPPKQFILILCNLSENKVTQSFRSSWTCCVVSFGCYHVNVQLALSSVETSHSFALFQLISHLALLLLYLGSHTVSTSASRGSM